MMDSGMRFPANTPVDSSRNFYERLATKLSCAERVFHPSWELSALRPVQLWAWWRELAPVAGSRHVGWRGKGVALAILDASHLRRVAAYLTLRPHAEAIRRCVEGARLRALYGGLGSRAFERLYGGDSKDFGPPPCWDFETLGKIGFLALDVARFWPCPTWRALARAAFPRELKGTILPKPWPEAFLYQWLDECRVWLEEETCMSG